MIKRPAPPVDSDRYAPDRISQSITLLISLRLAEAEGLDDGAILRRVIRTAKVIRDETRDHSMYNYCRVLINPTDPQTVEGKRLSPTEVKLWSLRSLHRDMRDHHLC